jgi:hypothetical protein
VVAGERRPPRHHGGRRQRALEPGEPAERRGAQAEHAGLRPILGEPLPAPLKNTTASPSPASVSPSQDPKRCKRPPHTGSARMAPIAAGVARINRQDISGML